MLILFLIVLVILVLLVFLMGFWETIILILVAFGIIFAIKFLLSRFFF